MGVRLRKRVQSAAQRISTLLFRCGVVWSCGFLKICKPAWLGIGSGSAPWWKDRLKRSYLHRLSRLLRLVSQRRDEWAFRRLLRTMEELADDPLFMDAVLFCLSRPRWYWAARHDPEPRLPVDWVPFLLTPLPDAVECRHAPRVRLIAFFGVRDLFGLTNSPDLARWLLDNALHNEDAKVREALSALFGDTDEPTLLFILEEAFSHALTFVRRGEGNRGRVLWDGDRPGRLVRILQENPHLLQDPGEAGATRERRAGFSEVMLAILKGRFDLIDKWSGRYEESYAVVSGLLDGIDLPASEEFKDRCRRALRTLSSRTAQETLCSIAASSHAYGSCPEATAAVVEAGYVWEKHPAVLLFLTEQWDRYDALDPDGGLLRSYCDSGGGIRYRDQIRIIAERNGRPDPFPPPPPRPSDEEDGGTRRRSGIGGSWPTDAGIGTIDTGGGHGDSGGGFSDGGFSGGFGGFSF